MVHNPSSSSAGFLMLAWICFLLPASISASTGDPQIKFLAGFSRLNDTHLRDYYLSCETMGSNLTWRANQMQFLYDDSHSAGTVHYTLQNNFTYTSTLLSVQSTSGLWYFASILIVSTKDLESNINISCSSGRESSHITITGGELLSAAELDRESDDVFLQYLFSVTIVGNLTTIVYTCGVYDVFLEWVVDGASRFGFTSFEYPGQDRQPTLNDYSIARQQSILIGHEPYNLSTVLFVTGTQGNVTCSSQSHSAMIRSSDTAPSTSATVSSSTEISSSTFPHETTSLQQETTVQTDSTVRTPEEQGFLQKTENVIMLICIVGGVPLLGIILLVVLVIIMAIKIGSDKETREKLKGDVDKLKNEIQNSGPNVLQFMSRRRSLTALFQ